MIDLLTKMYNTSMSGFWEFVGTFMLLALPIKLLMFLVQAPLRHRILSKHGYPPASCNVDGFYRKKDER